MGYLIAAYAVGLAALGLYGVHLVRERRSLLRALDAHPERKPG